MERTVEMPPVEMRFRMKTVRDYSSGSISERIARAESKEELEQWQREVKQLAADGRLSKRAQRRIDAAGWAKARELASRLILPPPKRLIVPRGGLVL